VRKRREKEEVWERNIEDGKRHHWLQRADGEEAPVAQSGSRVRCRSVDWAQKHGPYLEGVVDGDHLGWAVRLSRATTGGHPSFSLLAISCDTVSPVVPSPMLLRLSESHIATGLPQNDHSQGRATIHRLHRRQQDRRGERGGNTSHRREDDSDAMEGAAASQSFPRRSTRFPTPGSHARHFRNQSAMIGRIETHSRSEIANMSNDWMKAATRTGVCCGLCRLSLFPLRKPDDHPFQFLTSLFINPPLPHGNQQSAKAASLLRPFTQPTRDPDKLLCMCHQEAECIPVLIHRKHYIAI